MSTEQQSTPKCENPFFPCKNTETELTIDVTIEIAGVKYSICRTCWIEISDSDDYTWSQDSTKKPKLSAQLSIS